MTRTEKVISLLQLAEDHRTTAYNKIRNIMPDPDDSVTPNAIDFDNSGDFHLACADEIAEKIETLKEALLHLETTRTLLMTQTLTSCPNCGYIFSEDWRRR